MLLSFGGGDADEQSRKLHWKSWSKMGVSKEHGGLSFRNFQAFNNALLAKQLWRLITQPNLFMCKVLKAKYFPRGGLLNAEAKNHSSWLWRSWIGAKNTLQKGIRYQVGDGKSIKIWDTPWLPSCPNFKPRTRKPDNCSLTWVSELMTSDGKTWNLDLIRRIFIKGDAEAILHTPISQLGTRDKLVWNHTRNGILSVDSAYQWITNQQMPDKPESSTCVAKERNMWRRLWSMNIKGKIKHFLWRAYHNILPTGNRLLQKGLQIDAICKCCGEGPETIEHLFFDCAKSQIIWKLAPTQWEGLQQYTQDFPLWWQHACNISKHESCQARLEATACLLWGI